MTFHFGGPSGFRQQNYSFKDEGIFQKSAQGHLGQYRISLQVKTFEHYFVLPIVKVSPLPLPVKCCPLVIAIPGPNYHGNQGAISMKASPPPYPAITELFCAPVTNACIFQCPSVETVIWACRGMEIGAGCMGCMGLHANITPQSPLQSISGFFLYITPGTFCHLIEYRQPPSQSFI